MEKEARLTVMNISRVEATGLAGAEPRTRTEVRAQVAGYGARPGRRAAGHGTRTGQSRNGIFERKRKFLNCQCPASVAVG